MSLRWWTCVVTGAGSDHGRDLALRLARLGAGVLCVDPDRAAAETTAEAVRLSRVAAWSWQSDPASPDDRQWLADRVRDLGGADALVATGDTDPGPLADLLGLSPPSTLVDADPAAVLAHLEAAGRGTSVRVL